jgi:peptidoglycan biosynthesis protein MviN/MurJ (putative lipid II flippase)
MMRIATLLGTPSVTLLVLVADLLARRLFHRALFSQRERSALLLVVAALSIVLYGSALGYIPIDAYRAGFSPWAPVVLAVVAAAVALRSLPLACTAVMALVAYDVPLFASVNLFDYVVDPILGVIALGYTAFRTAASFSAKRPAS